MTGPREASVIATIQRNAKKRGAWLANLHGDGTGRAGLPDLVLCYRGRFVAVEAKRPHGGATSALQRVELDRVRRAGGAAIVATNWRDVADELDAIDASLDALAAHDAGAIPTAIIRELLAYEAGNAPAPEEPPMPTLTYTGQLVINTCWCGIRHAIPSELDRMLDLSDKNHAYCPLGHQYVRNSETHEKRAARLASELAAERRRVDATRDLLAHEERSHRATRGHLTRQKRRVAAGVCPCCNRTFQQLARHIAGQHPEYTP